MSPSPNVSEIHAMALHVCIPISCDVAAKLTKAPAQLSIYDGSQSAHLVVVVDYLYSIKSYVGFGRFFGVPLQGWMTKVNLLVEMKNCDDHEDCQGYQILNLDFEAGIKGFVKKVGAIATQRVPTTTSKYFSSISGGDSGDSGTAFHKKLNQGDRFQATVTTRSGEGCESTVVHVDGHIAELTADESKFVEFVVKRPHKFLLQKGDDLAYSPWGEGWKSQVEGTKKLDARTVEVKKLLTNCCGLEIANSCDYDNIFSFVQPSYEMVDYTNTKLS